MAGSTLVVAAEAAFKAAVKPAASFFSTAAFALSIAAETGANAAFAASLLPANAIAVEPAAATAVPAAAISLVFTAAEALPSSVVIVAMEAFASTFGAGGGGAGVEAVTTEAAGLAVATGVVGVVESQAPTSNAADRTPMDKETFTRFFFITFCFLPQLPSAVAHPAEGTWFGTGADGLAHAVRLIRCCATAMPSSAMG